MRSEQSSKNCGNCFAQEYEQSIGTPVPQLPLAQQSFVTMAKRGVNWSIGHLLVCSCRREDVIDAVLDSHEHEHKSGSSLRGISRHMPRRATCAHEKVVASCIALLSSWHFRALLAVGEAYI